MTISELQTRLASIKRSLGDVDVVFVEKQQFCNVLNITGVTESNCLSSLKWCYSGPVAMLQLDHS